MYSRQKPYRTHPAALKKSNKNTIAQILVIQCFRALNQPDHTDNVMTAYNRNYKYYLTVFHVFNI